MELVAQRGTDKVWFEEVEVGEVFQSPFNGQPFAVMLLVNKVDVPPAYRDALSNALVSAGCGYALCAGHDQEAWHTSIDLEAIRQNRKQSAEVVMTTSHPNETLSEVVEFLLTTTYFEGLQRDRFLVLFDLDNRVRSVFLLSIKGRSSARLRTSARKEDAQRRQGTLELESDRVSEYARYRQR